MSLETDAIIKAGCIQAAAVAWESTTLPATTARDPKIVADKIAEFAVMLFVAWTKQAPK